MSNEKPVELTEAEIRSLEEPLANWAVSRVWLDGTDPLCIEVARIVTARVIAAEQAGREDNALHDMCYVSGSKALEAREAAARREALQEAERLQTLLNSMDHFSEVAERCEAKSNEYAAKIARVEALADAAEATAVGPPFVFTRDLRAALAEPERDKESGR